MKFKILLFLYCLIYPVMNWIIRQMETCPGKAGLTQEVMVKHAKNWITDMERKKYNIKDLAKGMNAQNSHDVVEL